MIGTSAARFGYVGKDWLQMYYPELKFWYDIAVEMYNKEKRITEGEK
jgi:hypothetical protein